MEPPASPSGSQTPISVEGSFKTLAGQAQYDTVRAMDYAARGRSLLRELHIAPGSQAIVANGRVRRSSNVNINADESSIRFWDPSRTTLAQKISKLWNTMNSVNVSSPSTPRYWKPHLGLPIWTGISLFLSMSLKHLVDHTQSISGAVHLTGIVRHLFPTITRPK